MKKSINRFLTIITNIYNRIHNTIKYILSKSSKTERLIFFILFIVFLVSGLTLLARVNKHFMVEVPQYGGSISEGMIGTPKIINPLLAKSDTDKDLSTLIYSGLMRKDGNNNFIPDLAEKYEISEDGKTYTFILKKGLTFHDKKPLTTEDIVFTIEKIKDPAIKSSLRAAWDNVEVEVKSDREIIFRLNTPYSSFIYNTTVGILPKHIWQDVLADDFLITSRLNTEPIGSGPYKIDEIKEDENKIPVKYTLNAFKDFSLGEPYVQKINLLFYKNIDDLVRAHSDKKIDSFAWADPNTGEILQKGGTNIITFPLSRVFGLLINTSNAPILASRDLREALKLSTDKNSIVNGIFKGFARSIDTPFIENDISKQENQKITQTEREEKIKSLIKKAGFEKNDDGILVKGKEILKINITTANTPEFEKIADLIANNWKSLGADVTIRTYTPEDLNTQIIRPREFEILLFGMLIEKPTDLYAFWHSSQRNDPFLNITNYASQTVDAALDILQNSTKTDEINKNLEIIKNEFNEDTPAIFLYSPDLIYVTSKKLKGVEKDIITSGSERFLNIYKWYLDTDYIWKIFTKNN
jgi:peptide/nickel transport system substrate-binding protein